MVMVMVTVTVTPGMVLGTGRMAPCIVICTKTCAGWLCLWPSVKVETEACLLCPRPFQGKMAGQRASKAESINWESSCHLGHLQEVKCEPRGWPGDQEDVPLSLQTCMSAGPAVFIHRHSAHHGCGVVTHVCNPCSGGVPKESPLKAAQKSGDRFHSG
jgi:hypothetical protein